MSVLKEPVTAQPFVAVLSHEQAPDWAERWAGLRACLEQRLGVIDFEAGPSPFTWTEYYADEFGSPLSRRLLAFGPLMLQDRLREFKLLTQELEEQGADAGGRRRFNLDPGLLTQERVVLGTGKNFTHKIYLGDGVFADLTLVYKKNCGWQSLPWTFAEYSTGPVLDWMERLRGRYRDKL